MRLYDFHCDACGEDFEELVREVSDARCPSCASASVTKELSAFAVGGSPKDAAPAGCNVMACGAGACGRGGCGMPN